MIHKLLLGSVFVVLAYGFWLSPNFKEIAAGVAIFLFGMTSLQDGFKAFTGGLLENLLKHTTDKLWKSLSFGVISTALMQSSTLVSLITISFLSAGLISLVAGIGIIFGANLGTTTGAWLVAAFGLKVNIAAYAMPILVFGMVMLFQNNKTLKGLGYILAGIGFVFLGIHYMKAGFDSFQDSFDLTAYALGGYRGVLLFTTIGMLATVVMQSSHATLVLIITALAVGQVTYENALALAIGANLGTAITAIIGALGANIDGKRLVAAHLIFNLVTAAVAIIFIFQLVELVDWVSDLLAIDENNYTLRLAVFHSIFNSLGILLMLPLISRLERLLKALLPEKPRSTAQPRYLHKASIELSDTVIEAVRKETIHLYDNAFDIIAAGLRLAPADVRSTIPLKTLLGNHYPNRAEPIDIEKQYNNTIKALYSSIIEYISTALPEMTSQQANQLFSYRTAGRDIVEAIKDSKHLQKNLTRYARTTNPYLRQEYNDLCLNLAAFLRELEDIKTSSDDEPAGLSLDSLRLQMKDNDNILSNRLESAIRSKKVSSEQAISLMNDSNYVYEVTKSLVKMGETLFFSESEEIKEIEQALQLEDAELDTLLDQRDSLPLTLEIDHETDQTH